MGRKSLVTSLLALVLALGLQATASADASGVLALVPDQAAVVVATPGVDDFESGLAAFIDAVHPGSSAAMSAKLRRILTFGADVPDGIDFSSPAVFMVFLPDGMTFSLMGGFEPADPSDEPHFVMALPVKNFDSWRAALGESTGREEGAPYEYVHPDIGPRSYFTYRNGYLVLAKEEAYLDGWSAALATPLSAPRKTALLEAVARAPLAVNVSAASIRQSSPALLDDLGFDENMFMVGGIQHAQMAILDAYVRAFKDIYNAADEVVATVSPSRDGLKLSYNVQVAPDSLFHTIFAEQTPVDLSDLSLMPSDALFYGAMSMKMDAAADYVGGFLEDLVRSMSADEEAADVENAVAFVKTIIENARKHGLGENASFAVLKGGEGEFMNAAVAYRTPTPQAALDALVEQNTSVYSQALSMKFTAGTGLSLGEPQITDETISGTPVKVIKQSFDMEDAEPMVSQMLNAVWGDGVTSRLAAAPAGVLLAIGSEAGLMEKLLAGSAGGIDAAKLEKSLATIEAPEPSAVAFVSLPAVMALQLSLAQEMMGMEGSGPMLFPPPPSPIFTTAAVSFSDRTARLDLYVPTTEIQGAIGVVMQMMMAGQAVGEPEWQDEADPASKSRANLKQIVLGVGMYQTDYDEDMPPNLQTLLDDGYIQDASLLLRGISTDETFDPARIDATGDYAYARIKDAKVMERPAQMPIVWEKEVWNEDGTVAVAWADLHVSNVTPAELKEKVELYRDKYESVPDLP